MTTSFAPRPRVSVIVLNYNGASLIGRCLDHLIAQTLRDFEIIVVDNASSDESRDILDHYASTDGIRVLLSPTNRGVPGGRNLGLAEARGEIVAFIDNDGFAHPDWLENAVPVFDDPSVGAVASLVFFRRKKIIVNGAGGTLNLRGYGGDHCFRTSYEFARLPDEVLYPMGCGMLVRRSTMDEIGRFDEKIFNYYDDVELGIGVWNSGKRVVLCPDAWVDHDYSSSTTTTRDKMYLCERNRIRTVLKYFPLRLLPRWLLHERALIGYLRWRDFRSIPFRAWGWNLCHLVSALAHRRRASTGRYAYWHLMHWSWGQYPPPLPEEHVCETRLGAAGAKLDLGTEADASSLLFGWFAPEQDGTIPYRWSAPAASLVCKLEEPASRCTISFRSPRPDQRVRIVLRRLGEIDPAVELPLDPPAPHWSSRTVSCDLGAGTYEVLVLSNPPLVDPLGRELGAGLASISFDSKPSASQVSQRPSDARCDEATTH
ncbi:MAG: glycosyltransferase family 2 protein [Deltaproteobacteria bacterium]|nr:glycosyltransferase family 2 protein [Deltaproteobacteria bacterium]